MIGGATTKWRTPLLGDGAVMTPAMKDAEMKLKNGDEMRLMNAAVMTLTMLKGGVD